MHKKRIEENHFNKRTGSEVKLSHQTAEIPVESHDYAQFELCYFPNMIIIFKQTIINVGLLTREKNLGSKDKANNRLILCL